MTWRTVKLELAVVLVVMVLNVTALGQPSEYNQPWKNPDAAIVIDPFEGNDIDWDKLGTDKRVVAIIHRATIGDRADRKYAARKIEAKQRGYKWGAYHYGKPGNPIAQANFFLDTVKPEPDDLIALDLESPDTTKHMSFEDARIFINHIKEKTGRYPVVYANNLVVKAINQQLRVDDVFRNTRLWYARFKPTVTDFPKGAWNTYTLWQFSSELNCAENNRNVCLYTVPGTAYDMDVNVFNGTIEELRNQWPF